MTTPPETESAADYAEYRRLMFSIAYRMTGSISDAEDIVQEAFLRLTRARREGASITAPKAYLATVTTRLAISHLRSARVRREAYVGAWLPEPLVTGELDPITPAPAPDPAERAEMSDSLSMAFLVLLESLSPTERAVFLLHEVFGYDYREIAEITGKSEPNCRQIFARARQHVDRGKPRFEASREQRDEVTRRFFEAVGGGDLNGLLELLAPDVVTIGDGGGKGKALREPLHGPERVARFILGLFRRAQKEGAYTEPALVNGQPGAVAYDSDGRVAAVFTLDIADGQIQALRSVVNPDKLQHLGPVSDLYLRPDQDLPWRSWPPTSPRRPRSTRSWRASRTPRTRGFASCSPAWSGTCTPSSGTPSRPSPNGSGPSSSSPRPATRATVSGRNSFCCPTCSASPCWWRRSTTGRPAWPPNPPCSARSTW
jgi:RNA polymerase sigma-70 factor (TIGR02957 family)